MWPFKRSKKSKNNKVPAEVQQYYDSEHRERVGLAWLIAFLSLIVTVLIVVGLFFGGRWAYRKVANKDNSSSTSQTATNQGQSTQPESGAASQQSGTSQNQSQSQPSSQSNTSQSSGENSAEAGTGSASSTQFTGSTSGEGTAQNISNTGPGNVVAIFGLTTAVGYLLHRMFTKFKLNRSSNN